MYVLYSRQCSHYSVCGEVIGRTEAASLTAAAVFHYTSVLLSYARLDAKQVSCWPYYLV